MTTKKAFHLYTKRRKTYILRVTTLIHTKYSMHSYRYGLETQVLYPPTLTVRLRLHLLLSFQRATSRRVQIFSITVFHHPTAL